MQERLRQIVHYWLPPVIWMGVVFGFSTDHFSGAQTGSVFDEVVSRLFPGFAPEWIDRAHLLTRKMGHLTEYAILAILWARGFRGKGGGRARRDDQQLFLRRHAAWILILVSFYAGLDEWHQSWTDHRTGSVWDVLLDTVGGLGGLLLWWIWLGWRPSRSIRQ
jgi:VanZ family protein